MISSERKCAITLQTGKRHLALFQRSNKNTKKWRAVGSVSVSNLVYYQLRVSLARRCSTTVSSETIFSKLV